MAAYYNENEPVAAEWLRRLIAAGLIAPGEVDERDIRDVAPDDLSGFTQCHFFAGIGIWSGALRAAGWSDDDEIWTGSCPCQPYSAAGRGEGFADERHLWPHWHWLIAHRRPRIVLGEQVASKDGLGWNDLVSADMAATGYAFASVDLAAGGVGLGWEDSAYSAWLERALHDCPDPMVARHIRDFADWARSSLGIGGLHIRQRQYFAGVADEPSRGRGERGHEARPGPRRYADGGGGPSGRLSDESGQRRQEGAGLRGGRSSAQRDADATDHGPDGGLVNGQRPGLEGLGGDGQPSDQGGRLGRPGPGRSAAEAGQPGGLADNGRRGVQSGDRARGERGAAGGNARKARQRKRGGADDTAGGASGGLGNGPEPRCQGPQDAPGGAGNQGPLGAQDGRAPGAGQSQRAGTAGDLGDPEHLRCDQIDGRDGRGQEGSGSEPGHEPDRPSGADGPGQADGKRSPFDWLLCRDGVWRAARPGTLPLAHAVAGRVGKLRAYGNGLDYETATEFCRTIREMREAGEI